MAKPILQTPVFQKNQELTIFLTFFWITCSRNILEDSQAPDPNQRSKLDAFLILTGPINLIICGEVVIICWTASWCIKVLSALTLKDAFYLLPQQVFGMDKFLLQHIAAFYLARISIYFSCLDQCILLFEDGTTKTWKSRLTLRFMKVKSLKLYHQKKTLDLIAPDSEDTMNYKHFIHLKILHSQSHSAEFLQRYEWICYSAHRNLSKNKKKLARHSFSTVELKLLAR